MFDATSETAASRAQTDPRTVSRCKRFGRIDGWPYPGLGTVQTSKRPASARRLQIHDATKRHPQGRRAHLLRAPVRRRLHRRHLERAVLRRRHRRRHRATSSSPPPSSSEPLGLAIVGLDGTVRRDLHLPTDAWMSNLSPDGSQRPVPDGSTAVGFCGGCSPSPPRDRLAVVDVGKKQGGFVYVDGGCIGSPSPCGRPAEIGSRSQASRTRTIATSSSRRWSARSVPTTRSVPVRLTDDPADDEFPAWSADGSTIFYDNARPNSARPLGILVHAGDLERPGRRRRPAAPHAQLGAGRATGRLLRLEPSRTGTTERSGRWTRTAAINID